MLAQDQDDDAVDLMRRVRRLEFEETSDSFRDATDGYAFYRAAVLFIEERDRPRFTEAALQRVLPRLAETARHNGTDHVDRIHLRLLRPEASGGRPSHAATLVEVRPAQPPRPAGPAQSGTSAPARITQVTRRRLFDALREAGVTWSGSLDEVSFLRRLYDLDRLESTDKRFPTAEGDIVQHRYNNPDDWEDDWVFSDSRFQLDQGPDDVLLRFLAEMVHPEVRTDDQETEQLVHLFNTVLARDGFRFTPVSTISGYPIYEALGLIPPPQRPPSAQSRESAAPAAGRDGYEEVRRQAHGDPKAYRRDKFPHPDSNQADVFRATHKKTGIVVAMKQLRVRSTGGMRPPA
ncbi:AbiJ-related protein [Streptomyces sp. NPDC055709]